MQICTWSAPTAGNIYLKLVINLQNAYKFIDENKEKKITLTHIALKALG